MKATTVRFSDTLWEAIEAEADRQGVSAAQLIREATILRVSELGGIGREASEDAAVLRLRDRARETDRLARDDGPVYASRKVLSDPARLQALELSGLLDSEQDPAFDRVTQLASRLLDAPVALVSLVTEDRQFFKSCVGLPERWAAARETPLSHSFCQHVVDRRSPLLISDAREHPLVRDNLAIRDLDVVAYAGIPLVTDGGQVLGSFCVIDDQPREWTADQVSLLEDLAGTVADLISAGQAELPPSEPSA